MLLIKKVAELKSGMVSEAVRVEAGKEQGQLGKCREELLKHLKDSSLYDVDALLAEVRASKCEMFDEQVLLCTKGGNPEKAIDILVHNLNHFELAERYCQNNATEKHSRGDLLIMLLKSYLRPNEGGTPVFQDKAIHLLNTCGSDLDLLRVLEVLPSDLSLQKLSRFFPDVIRTNHHAFREGQIVKSMIKIENIQVTVRRDVTCLFGVMSVLLWHAVMALRRSRGS
jgi:hypothetical protein